MYGIGTRRYKIRPCKCYRNINNIRVYPRTNYELKQLFTYLILNINIFIQRLGVYNTLVLKRASSIKSL